MENQNIKNFPRYERYKDSGVDWIGEIPEHWESLATKRVFYLACEASPKNHNYELLSVYTDIGVRPRKELEERGNKASNTDEYWIVKSGDIVVNKLLAWMGAVGYSAYDGVTSPAYDILRPVKVIEPKFYHYLFRTDTAKQEFRRNSKGIMDMRLRLYFSELGKIMIPLPDIQEQTAIVQFLDHKTAQIDRAIAIKEEQIKLLNERKQIMIQEAVTKGLDPTVPMKDSGVEWIGEIPEHWEVRALKYVARINQNSLDEATNKNLEIEYVDIGSVSYAHGIEKTEKYLFANAPSRARRIAKKGDTIVSTVRTYLKSIDYIDSTKEKYIFSTGFAVISPKTSIHSEYLTSFVGSLSFTNQVDTASTGISYPAINSTRLSNLWVVVPSRTEQEEIVMNIKIESKSFNRSILVYQNQIKALKEYKTTLINEAVTGKIKVN